MATKTLNRIIGIEIAENNIIAVEIQFTKNSINILGGFRLNLPVFQNLTHTVELFKQALKASNMKTRDCAVGLSMQYFKLSPVTIPKTIPESEISSIIAQESNVDLSADSLAFLPLYSTQRQDADGVFRFDVLGMSMSKALIDVVKMITAKCGLNLTSVTPSFLGLGSYLEQRGANNLISTLWISHIRSELIVWLGKEPIYEHLFLTHQLNEQVTQSLTYLISQLPGTQISNMFLTGPFVKETNLSQLPYNLQFISLPPNFLDMGKVLQHVALPELVTSLGIALSASGNTPFSAPNLLLSSDGKSESKGLFGGKDFSKLSRSGKLNLDSSLANFLVPSALILAFTIFAQIYISSVLLPSVSTDQSTYSSRIALSEAHLKKVQSLDRTNKVLNIKTQYLSELIDKRKSWSGILQEIGNMTPRGLWIDRLEVKNASVDVFGRALTVDSVANFSINLNYNSKFLNNAQIISLRKFQEEGIDIIEFQISAKTHDPIPDKANVENQALNKQEQSKT
jgi:Tfp pilus assembly protein PilN